MLVTVLAWAGVIIGGAALMVAVPSALQMIYGKPRVVFAFTTFPAPRDHPGATVLGVTLQNTPVGRPMLRRLGVRRETAEEVQVGFVVSESTGKILTGVVSPLIDGENPIRMPASHAPRTVPVVMAEDGATQAEIFVAVDKRLAAGLGMYHCEIHAAIPSTGVQESAARYFSMSPGRLTWEGEAGVRANFTPGGEVTEA